MDIFLYTIIFIIGTFFGSFFTLAVYRIPRKEDILIKHSYCPNCNHKLGFFDLFPVFSYLLLKGKCKYCGNKIRPRYLILEILSGFAFLLIAVSLRISFNNIASIVNLSTILIYISLLIIVAGIDKEKKCIQRNVLVVGYVIETLYIIYQCTLGNINVYQYVIYFAFLISILIASNISLKITAQEKYYIQILYLSLYMIIFCGSQLFIMTVILFMLILSIYCILCKRKKIEIPIGFFLCVSNILIIIFSNILLNYII